MLGISGEEEEQPARRSAVDYNISIWNVGSLGGKLHSKMMAMAISIMRMW